MAGGASPVSFTARVVCCGCQRDMGTKEGFTRPGVITSGLCSACEAKVYRELAAMALEGRAVVSVKKSENIYEMS